MEGGINADAPLDYVAFEISPTQNRYEAFVCHDNRIEKVASGLLEQLKVGLPEVTDFQPEEPNDNFKLQLPESMRDSAWFTKSTLARFLHVVGAPELLKISNSIGIEMSQLEEARRFHLALYSQGHQAHQESGETDSYNSKDTESTQKPEGPEPSISSSDATKNELLRAMDFRLTALREDLAASFNRAAGATCSTKQIADLMAFSEHFGALDLRNFLCKYLAMREDQIADPQTEKSNLSRDSKNESEKVSDGMAQECSPVKTFKAIKYGASPAKAAQLERQSSTGSEGSSNSSDEERSFMERSRPLVRSGSSRRSASPMRRVQIGKSGSRRAAALTIKSLSYFPARERVSSNRDASGNGSEDEESNQPPKKPESNVRRMSVKDAINLFERKQTDQKSDVQIKMPSPDVSISTNKAVLRRWSSGMGDSSNQCASENGSEGSVQTTAHVTEDRQTISVEVKPDSDFITESLNPSNSAHVGASSIAKCEKKTSDLKDHPVDTVVAQAEETRVTSSVEWSRQKEAELSQMLKMMEKKPVRSRNMATGNSRSQDLTSEQRGGFYDHYKQKRDEKLRGQNSGKRAEKEEQFKALQDILDQRKAEMASKNMTSGRQSALAKPKSEKKLSPSVQPRKESLKPAVPRKPSPKASPKASPLPATRKSWPSAPSPKTTGPTPTKTPNGISSTGTTPTRRKSQPTSSPTRSNPKVERPQQQPKSLKGTQTETKRSLKAKEEKQQQAVTRGSSKVTKTKSSPPASGDGPGIVPTKPSFYSKVTRKGSVVPLESKPFLRKGSGIGPGVGPVVVKTTKASQSDESLKNSENPVKAQEEVVIASPGPVTQQQVGEIVPSVSNDTDLLQPVASVNRQQNCEDTENHDQFLAEGDSCEKTTEFPVEVQSEEVSTISPNAWVEIEEHQELPVSCDINSPEIATTNNTASAALSSPRVRHSLSQMLQEESGEPEIIEWGNAENPPAMVYQKDAPKGLKRLLKFARKSKGESNITGWSSPSVFSEGEEEAEESKAASKRNADAVLRKAALQANKGYGLQKTSFGDNYNGENPNTRTIESIGDLLSAQSNISKYNAQSSHKLAEGHALAAASSTKATRSFFSLSTFRSSKSNETKLR